MHLKQIKLFPEKYPCHDFYPFNLPIFQQSYPIYLETPIAFFIGENGTGKSTLLKAISMRCGIHIWDGQERTRYRYNPYENDLYKFISVSWEQQTVPGSYFASQIFRNFAQLLDEWASMDSNLLDYFGGKSLLTQSHGQSLISFFKSRFQKKGLYLLDEPETALSPKTQLELLRILIEASGSGMAQFIIATHSPILLACPNSIIYSFNEPSIQPVDYYQTEYYQFYDNFRRNISGFLKSTNQSHK